MYKLTEKGQKTVKAFIKELAAKRKEILDAKLDAADETTIPTVEEIEEDIAFIGIDSDGDYYNGWGVTDSPEYDMAIALSIGIDFLPDEDYLKITKIDWDTDGEKVRLPEEVYIPASEFDGINADNHGAYDSEIADYLSDTYEYCVKSFVPEYKSVEGA